MPVEQNKEKNINYAVGKIQEAADPGAKLVVLPVKFARFFQSKKRIN